MDYKYEHRYTPGRYFDGYHHPQLDRIITLIDKLYEPVEHGQPRQMSLLLYGPPGTGKSSLARHIAESRKRHIIVVKLDTIATKLDLYNIFLKGNTGTVAYGIDSVIIELDELDKSCRKIIERTEKRKREQEREQLWLDERIHYYRSYTMQPYVAVDADASVSAKTDASVSAKTDTSAKTDASAKADANANANGPDWDIYDLLSLLSGSIVPDKRIIIGTCNDISVITNLCPELVRHARLTPIECPYGDAALFIQIVQSYTQIELSAADLPTDYRFVQAGLIEYIRSLRTVTRSDLLKNLDTFRANTSYPKQLT